MSAVNKSWELHPDVRISYIMATAPGRVPTLGPTFTFKRDEDSKMISDQSKETEFSNGSSHINKNQLDIGTCWKLIGAVNAHCNKQI